MSLVRFLHVLSLSFWQGATLFLFVFAPGVFATLPRERAAEAMNAIFPRYHALELALAAVALVTLLVLPERTTARLVLLGSMLVLLVVATAVVSPALSRLGPELNEARAAAAAGQPAPQLEQLQARWGRLHGASMALNLVQLLLGVALLWVTIASLAPWAPPALEDLPVPPAGPP